MPIRIRAARALHALSHGVFTVRHNVSDWVFSRELALNDRADSLIKAEIAAEEKKVHERVNEALLRVDRLKHQIEVLTADLEEAEEDATDLENRYDSDLAEAREKVESMVYVN